MFLFCFFVITFCGEIKLCNNSKVTEFLQFTEEGFDARRVLRLTVASLTSAAAAAA